MSRWGAAPAGALCGLAWAAALRGWMAELAGAESTVTWLTVLLVLLPGAVVGGVVGHAALLRLRGGRPWRIAVLVPVVLAAALLDPAILTALVTTGQGGGALLVVVTMLAGGRAIGRRGRPAVRVAAIAVAILGVAAMFAAGGIAAPPTTPRGLWVAVLGASLLAVGALASAIPYGHDARVPPRASGPARLGGTRPA